MFLEKTKKLYHTLHLYTKVITIMIYFITYYIIYLLNLISKYK